jgi:hypothetical protein
VCISVMDYLPVTLYQPPGMNYFWPFIDDAIRAAAFRGVHVRMLISNWTYRETVCERLPSFPVVAELNFIGRYSERRMFAYLQSLQDFGANISIKLFVVPSTTRFAAVAPQTPLIGARRDSC